jgi:hypothetical protein
VKETKKEKAKLVGRGREKREGKLFCDDLVNRDGGAEGAAGFIHYALPAPSPFFEYSAQKALRRRNKRRRNERL